MFESVLRSCAAASRRSFFTLGDMRRFTTSVFRSDMQSLSFVFTIDRLYLVLDLEARGHPSIVWDRIAQRVSHSEFEQGRHSDGDGERSGMRPSAVAKARSRGEGPNQSRGRGPAHLSPAGFHHRNRRSLPSIENFEPYPL